MVMMSIYYIKKHTSTIYHFTTGSNSTPISIPRYDVCVVKCVVPVQLDRSRTIELRKIEVEMFGNGSPCLGRGDKDLRPRGNDSPHLTLGQTHSTGARNATPDFASQ
jgi:hypothetical protein